VPAPKFFDSKIHCGEVVETWCTGWIRFSDVKNPNVKYLIKGWLHWCSSCVAHGFYF
jgi:hypothetical protein